MPFKPMRLKDYLKWIAQYGWTLEKGIDLKLYNEAGQFQASIKVIHPPGNEVCANSVKKTRQALKKAGLE